MSRETAAYRRRLLPNFRWLGPWRLDDDIEEPGVEVCAWCDDLAGTWSDGSPLIDPIDLVPLCTRCYSEAPDA